jgi:hypothetical protein
MITVFFYFIYSFLGKLYSELTTIGFFVYVFISQRNPSLIPQALSQKHEQT